MKSYNYERVGLMLKHINEREEKTIKILESEYRVFNIEIMELSNGKTAFIDLVEV